MSSVHNPRAEEICHHTRGRETSTDPVDHNTTKRPSNPFNFGVATTGGGKNPPAGRRIWQLLNIGLSKVPTLFFGGREHLFEGRLELLVGAL